MGEADRHVRETPSFRSERMSTGGPLSIETRITLRRSGLL